RNYGHFEGDAQKYKKEQEKMEHKQEKDAIALFRNYLLNQNLLAEKELISVENAVEESIKQAVKFSEESPYPEASDLLNDVYVSY
ncbi:thiamine pyrophosphate-dependent enzyme, partial [Peribacillus frigoritolerans]